tara:strand:- start:5216 stop:5920 length:705 start_codon:yes stop_codon:yes gene_type:complete
MKLSNIVLGVAVILVLYFLYGYLFGGSSNKSSPSSILDGKSMQVIGANLLPANVSTNYGYSVWFYVDDWSYRLGEPKTIFDRTGKGANSGSPVVVFDPSDNNITISVATTGIGAASTSTCTINNVPLQAWTNLIITLNSRALDVYINGKLVKTCLLDAPPAVESGSSVRITPNGGFSGYTSKFQYHAMPLNPQQAYNIYKSGYGGSSGLGDVFNKYRVKIGFLENNREVNSFEI